MVEGGSKRILGTGFALVWLLLCTIRYPAMAFFWWCRRASEHCFALDRQSFKISLFLLVHGRDGDEDRDYGGME
jgi:hypothetical protein